jgi:uncharacterized phage-associated protein
MPFSTKSIANYFIDRAKDSGEKLSPMKVQKLVYYAMGWFAGYTGKPLVDDAVEAWQYGPVFPDLYHAFKKFGSGAITEKATELDINFEDIEIPAPDDPNVRKFLDNIWASYGKYTAVKLSEMTHAAGSPWDLTWQNSGGVRNKDIPFEVIQNHFKQAVDKAKTGTVAA